MKASIHVTLIVAAFTLMLAGQEAKGTFTILKGPYLGQKPPGMSPEIFALAIDSKVEVQSELSIVFNRKEIINKNNNELSAFNDMKDKTQPGNRTVHAAEKEIVLKWLGHSCFIITTADGTKILTDPVEFKGYHLPKGITAHIVTVSHNHVDHNRADAIGGNPIILKGTTANDQNVIPVDTIINNIKIFTVPSYHSPAKRGMNAIFIFEFNGIRIVHLGDLGTKLSNEQIKVIGDVDYLLIPVGGRHTISLSTANEVVEKLKVRCAVLPMHYRTAAFADLTYSAEDFVKGKQNVRRINGTELKIHLDKRPSAMEYIILNYKKAILRSTPLGKELRPKEKNICPTKMKISKCKD